MKKEIVFRGKDKDGKWHYGMPIHTHVGTYIVEEENPHVCSLYGYMEIDEFALVDANTVGQYTGLKDINGKEIFEGDIIKCTYIDGYKEADTISKVVFDAGAFSVEVNNDYCPCIYETRKIEVAGNVYDNPELLEK